MKAFDFINFLIETAYSGKDIAYGSYIRRIAINSVLLDSFIDNPIKHAPNMWKLKDMLNDLDITPFEIEDPLELAMKLNNWIKFADITKSERGHFLKIKHRFLKKCYQDGRITKVVKQQLPTSDGFLMTVDGKYSFHQPDCYFKDLVCEREGEFQKPVNMNYDMCRKDLYRFYILTAIYINK